MWLNYPNNPTGAVADLAFFEEAVAFAKKHDILICHDSAYSEMTYDGYVAPSIFEVPGAKDVAVEFGSCSKPFNMTGWRIGFVVGNSVAVKALTTCKSDADSGVFQAIQYAGMAGLNAALEMVNCSLAPALSTLPAVISWLADSMRWVGIWPIRKEPSMFGLLYLRAIPPAPLPSLFWTRPRSLLLLVLVMDLLAKAFSELP